MTTKSLEAAYDALENISRLANIADIDIGPELMSVSLSFNNKENAMRVKRRIQRDIQSLDVVPMVSADNPENSLLILGIYLYFLYPNNVS